MCVCGGFGTGGLRINRHLKLLSKWEGTPFIPTHSGSLLGAGAKDVTDFPRRGGSSPWMHILKGREHVDFFLRGGDIVLLSR